MIADDIQELRSKLARLFGLSKHSKEMESAMLLVTAAVAAARLDEVERAKNRKQIFDYYDDRIAELTAQPTEENNNG